MVRMKRRVKVEAAKEGASPVRTRMYWEIRGMSARLREERNRTEPRKRRLERGERQRSEM